jgi:hypothetical protein
MKRAALMKVVILTRSPIPTMARATLDDRIPMRRVIPMRKGSNESKGLDEKSGDSNDGKSGSNETVILDRSPMIPDGKRAALTIKNDSDEKSDTPTMKRVAQ